MREILLALLVLLAAATTAAASPSLAAKDGSWVCLPDDQTAPQVMIDFAENVYRRCDQNTCSSYDILEVQRHRDMTAISFAPGAVMRADDDGGRYTEYRKTGDAIVTSSGGCSFRGDQPVPDGFEMEELRRRG